MIRIRQIKLDITKQDKESLKKKISSKLNISPKEIKDLKIVKKSLDARNKNNILYVYEIDIEVNNEKEVLKKNNSKDIFLSPIETYNFKILGNNKLKQRPIIVGAGPAGLFCAYILAENGYKPLIIERGEKVEERVKSIEKFWETNILNPNSNVQFGEGGAGTFSDGKLNTLTKDKENRNKKVFEIFIENGAPEEIMYINKPHIGTDILRNVIINMRNKIISMGGEFKYNTTLTNIIIEKESVTGIEINNNEIIPCEVLVLAIGHSARDTFKMLNEKPFVMEPKSFAIGVRIEHPQEMINISQYGENKEELPPAEYKLTYQTTKGRGVYSFCMCPGGYVVNASSEEKHLAINGMSNHKRDSKNANSAIVVTVSPNDFGHDILSGIKFQKELEKKAYEIGNGLIPLQTIKDFYDNKKTTKLGNVKPIVKGNYNYSNLNELLPSYISEAIKEALPNFDKKITGFNREDALLFGIETRTSSPIRIIRDEYGISSIKGVYPSGEGAGYAGGITTSAIDGLKTAENIAKLYY